MSRPRKIKLNNLSNTSVVVLYEFFGLPEIEEVSLLLIIVRLRKLIETQKVKSSITPESLGLMEKLLKELSDNLPQECKDEEDRRPPV